MFCFHVKHKKVLLNLILEFVVFFGQINYRIGKNDHKTTSIDVGICERRPAKESSSRL